LPDEPTINDIEERDVVRALKIRIVESLIEECESLGLLENGKMLPYVIYIPKVVRGGLAWSGSRIF
jgi:hypothetical protein